MVRHRPERVLLACGEEGRMTLGNIYTSEAPLPRSFECAMCGSDVTVTERRDHRMRFCCESCEKRFWKHADRYEGRKKTCSGHVTRLRREHDENRREAGL